MKISSLRTGIFVLGIIYVVLGFLFLGWYWKLISIYLDFNGNIPVELLLPLIITFSFGLIQIIISLTKVIPDRFLKYIFATGIGGILLFYYFLHFGLVIPLYELKSTL